MPLNRPADDPFLRLADNLREFELTIGEKARPVVSALRAELEQAVALRNGGDVAGALGKIRLAMERLAALASDLDAAEGAMMHATARRFADALRSGDRGVAKEAVGVMRRKSGENDPDGSNDW